jgi:methylation protein EvaC
MFNSKYPFLTGSSKFMVDHFQKFSEFISKNFIKAGEKIIEVGCNDGTMLNFFDRNKFDCLGFEPSTNIAKIAEKKNLVIIPDFFSCSHDLSKKFINETKVIYAANVICHIPDLNNLIKNVDKFLSKDGLFIFEEPYLGSMVEKVSYDQIYD